MTRVHLIRGLRDVEGKSVSEISRLMGVNWRTAKKYADGEVLPGGGPRGCRHRPVIGPFMEMIDFWLEEDTRMPAKQRRTARVIYREIRKLGYEGSERTVRSYVKESRERIQLEHAERYVRLEHYPGEAQVDFGRVKILESGGLMRDYSLMVMSFPHSNACLARVLPAENAECFLWGLRSLFDEAGGVPREIWLDNLSPVVKKIRSGEDRVVTDTFERFQWHYRFNARFCNPGRGNEKGSVENKVGYVRKNYLTPPPVADDIEDLNLSLSRDLRDDMDREHYRHKKLIKDLWEEDRTALLYLPTQPYEVFRPLSRVVNQVGEVKVDSHDYHVPQAAPGQRVFLKVHWDMIEVYDRLGEEKLGEVPRHYAFKADQVDWAAELRVLSRKPRAVERATYIKALPQSLRDFILKAEVSGRSARMKTLIALFESGYSLESITETVEAGHRYGVVDTASLKAVAGHRMTMQKAGSIPEPHTPEQVRGWRPDLTSYDRLTDGVAGDD